MESDALAHLDAEPEPACDAPQMSAGGVHFSQFRRRSAVNGGDEARHEIQQLWFRIARDGWKSLVLVPADAGISVARIATSLAEVGGRLRDAPVTAIVADSLDYESARMLADLQLRARLEPRAAPHDVELERVDSRIVPISASASAPPRDPEPDAARPASAAREAPPRDARLMPPAGQVILAIQPVVVEPLGVAIAQAADAVILCVEIGRTRLQAARRTIDLIGADRIAGACVLR
jgi:hypothetical protein